MVANQLLAFVRRARDAARRTLPPHGRKFAPRTFTQRQLLACLLLEEHLRLDYRTTEDLFRASGTLRRTLGLRRVPDHSTLWWFARHKLSPDLIQAALAATVRDTAAGRESFGNIDIALASTGLWLAHTSRYCAWRAKRNRGQRGWLKWALALWRGPQILLAQRVRPSPCGDFSDLPPLATAAHAVLPFRRLVADAGYDSEANHAFCRRVLGADSLIPTKKRRSAKVIATTPYRQEMCVRLGVGEHPADRRAYRQRWRVETVMSVSKRKWGEALTARSEATQAHQALLRGVVYNLHRLGHLAAP